MNHRAFWAGLTLSLVTLVVPALGQGATGKPRVPPGADPGGLAVAIIGGGIDYTQPAIAKRLARDGEGEIIGWDFIDNDRRPYAACLTPGNGPACHAPRLAALPAKPLVRIAPFRASMTNPQSLVASVQAIAQTDIRIIGLMLDPPPPLAFLLDAAKRFPKLVFVGTVAEPDPSSPGGARYIAMGDKHSYLRSHSTTDSIISMAAYCSLADAPVVDVVFCTAAEARAGPF